MVSMEYTALLIFEIILFKINDLSVPNNTAFFFECQERNYLKHKASHTFKYCANYVCYRLGFRCALTYFQLHIKIKEVEL